MAIFSPLASRRQSRRIAEVTQQLIVFRLRDENFALPIRTVQKVIPIDKIYGAPGGNGVSLTLYQDQELIVIDVGRRIFRGRPSEDSFKSELHHQTEEALQNKPLAQGYLLIVQNSMGLVVGLPIEEPPSLLRVPESAFTPLSASYISEGNLRCVSVLIKKNNDEPPLFLINPDQLVQAEPALPPAVS